MTEEPTHISTWQIIRTMGQRGFHLEAGPHSSGLRGYYALFTPNDDYENAVECDECGQALLGTDNWDSCAHAMTLQRAVIAAARMALGKTVAIMPVSEFRV